MEQGAAYFVFVEGLDDVSLSSASGDVLKAATAAINSTAKFARADSADMIRKRYNFPGNYLDPSQGRLIVSKFAQTTNLESVINARRRATSLSRFIISSNGDNKRGVVIEQLRGKSAALKGAFPVTLKNGNRGLAVRTKGRVHPSRAFKPQAVKDKHGRIKFWLLYGMSVNQAFIYASKMEEDRASVYLQSEFTRLLEEVKL